MGDLFQTYLTLGFKHIADPKAYDHIVFIVALCAIYRLSEWKKVAILVTAFTIGHSLTLALAVLDIIRFPKDLIETLIPITILLTCLFNIYMFRGDAERDKLFSRKLNLNYLIALGFGLIHGMGFSNFLRSMIMPGEESNLVQQLLAFNIGVELGQLLIVAIILIVGFIVLKLIGVKQRDWNLFISGAAAGIAISLLI